MFFAIVLLCCLLFTGSIASSAKRRYKLISYSKADLEAFRPAGATRCTDGGEIWHEVGKEGGPKVHPPCQISFHRCNDKGIGPQKLKFLLRFY